VAKPNPRPTTAAVDDHLLDIHEAAKKLLTTPGVLRKWRYQRKGPESFRLAGKVVYKQSALDAYIESERDRTSRGGAPSEPAAQLPTPATSTRRRLTKPTK
jgi:hypothetical protein